MNARRILFIHPNFPGQFRYLLKFCAGTGEFKLDFITEALPVDYPGVTLHRSYEPGRTRAESVGSVLRKLASKGYFPDLVISHSGWGSDLLVPEIFPEARFLSYPEWYYRAGNPRNLPIIKALERCTRALVPTEWQKSRFPARFHDKIRVIHEGVDTSFYRPDADAVFEFFGQRYTANDEIITYAARGQEPIRGFSEFMRALPTILGARPQAKILIAGEDRVCYGGKHPSGQSWRKLLCAELKLSGDRVIFCNKLPEEYFLKFLQVSSLHIYLTKDFILSWSLLDAMSCGCLILGSDTAPVREAVEHGRNGRLCPLTSEAIAAAAVSMLENRENLPILRSQAIRDIHERYDVSDCVRKQYQLIREMLDD